MFDLTIAICTIRNPIEFLLPTLNEIEACYKDGKSYEVLVYGPYPTHISHTTNPVYYTENFKHGNIYGYNLLARMAQGRNIAFLTDDMIVPKNLFEIVQYMDSRNFSGNPAEWIDVTGFSMHDGQDFSPFPDRLILPDFGWINGSPERILDRVQEKYGNEYAHSKIPLVRFIAGTKIGIEENMNSFLFHPAFRNGGGDQWLSLWSWYKGKPLKEELPVKLVQRGTATSVLSNLETDGETLRDLVFKLSLGYENYV